MTHCACFGTCLPNDQHERLFTLVSTARRNIYEKRAFAAELGTEEVKQECIGEGRRARKAMKYATAATYPMNMYGRFPEQHRPPERLPKHTRLDMPARASSNAKAMRQRAMEGRARQAGSHAAEEGTRKLGDVSVTTQRWPDPHRHPGSGPCELPTSGRPHRKPVLLRCRQGSQTPPHFGEEVFFFFFFPGTSARSREKRTCKTDAADIARHSKLARQTIAEKYRQIGGAPLSVGPFFFISFSARVERSRRCAMAIAETPSEQARDCYARSGWGKPAAQRDAIAEPDAPRQQRAFVGRK